MHDGPSAREIADMLDDRIEDVVADLYPGAVRIGGVAYCSAKGNKGKDLGSFQVNLVARGRAGKGSWYRFSAGVGGHGMQLVAYALTGTPTGTEPYRLAIEWAKRFFGIRDREETEEEKEAREKRKRDDEAKQAKANAGAEARRAKRRKTAGGQWHDGIPIFGTPAEAYLLNRGIPSDIIRQVCTPDVLRYNPEVPYEKPPFPIIPAMLGRACGVDGKGHALGRVFLSNDGRKADVEDPKLTIGSLEGGAVRLGGTAQRIGVAEGMETALGAIALCRASMPVWACLGTAGLGSFEVPPGVDEVVIYADGDLVRERNGKIITPGLDAARKLAGRLRASGIVVEIVEPPSGKDWLDVWCETKALFEGCI